MAHGPRKQQIDFDGNSGHVGLRLRLRWVGYHHTPHGGYVLPNVGSVAEWLGRSTCDQRVASSNPGLSAIECNPWQVVNAHVPLSPSSIIWYQPMGGDALRLGR